MKYIRTKDGHYGWIMTEEKRQELIACAKGDYGYIKFDIPIEKLADTIEELCDGYVVEYTGDSNSKLKGFWYMQYIEALKRLKKDRRRLFELLEVSTLKLFIKTDKGLIYVAQMNEKGELELI